MTGPDPARCKDPWNIFRRDEVCDRSVLLCLEADDSFAAVNSFWAELLTLWFNSTCFYIQLIFI